MKILREVEEILKSFVLPIPTKTFIQTGLKTLHALQLHNKSVVPVCFIEPDIKKSKSVVANRTLSMGLTR
jgi:hypothetical protein